MPEKIGRFEIRRFLGEGAFGAVFEAYDPQLDRAVAIKVAKLGRGDSDQRVKRFLREAKAAAGLRHPHIVPVYEFGREDDQFFIVAAFIQGQTLQQSLKRLKEENRAPDLKRSIRIIRQLADALAYAHGQGIVHRDVKPANVMLDAKDEPMLMDFGLATRPEEAEKLTHAGAILGTPLYMAPEQARGHEGGVIPASDQYSLGVMLFEMITGQPPFSGPPEIVMFKHVEEEPPRPSKLNAAVDRDLDTICLKCLEKKPEHRYSSEQAVASDLQCYLQGEPISVRRARLLERLVKWSRRKPTLAAAYGISVAAVLLSVLAASMGWLWQRAETARAEVVREREKLARFDYGRTVEAAYLAWQENNVTEALTLLNSAEQRLHGWEWHYVNRLCNGQSFMAEKVVSADMSLDGSRIVTAQAKEAIIWDSKTGEQKVRLPSLPTQSDYTWTLFSGDGKRFLTSDWEKTRVWDCADGREVFATPTNNIVRSVISSDGSRVFMHNLNKAYVWDAVTGKKVLDLPTPGSMFSTINPDGDRIFTCAKNDIRLWKVGPPVESVRLQGHALEINRAQFSQNGKVLVTVDNEGLVFVRDGQTGEIQSQPFLKVKRNMPSALGLSASGNRVAVAFFAGSLNVWDASNKESRTLPTGTGYVNAIAMTPDGSRIVTGSDDRTARVLDSTTGKELSVLKHPTKIQEARISPDGNRVLTLANFTVRLWDLRTQGTLEFTALPPEKNPTMQMPLAGNEFQIEKNAIGKGVTWSNRKGVMMDEVSPTSAAFSPDGKRGAVAFKDKRVVLWDRIANREVAAFQLDNDWSISPHIQFSPDGSKWFSPSRKGAGSILDAANGKELCMLPDGRIYLADFSPDGSKIVTASLSEGICVWNAASGGRIATVKSQADVPLDGLVFDPTGSKVAAANKDYVRLFDSTSGAEVVQMKGHTDQVPYLAFSPDGARLVTGSNDGTVRLWDVFSGAEVFKIKISGTRTSDGIIVRFSNDGKQLRTSTDGISFKAWDSAPISKTLLGP